MHSLYYRFRIRTVHGMFTDRLYFDVVVTGLCGSIVTSFSKKLKVLNEHIFILLKNLRHMDYKNINIITPQYSTLKMGSFPCHHLTLLVKTAGLNF